MLFLCLVVFFLLDFDVHVVSLMSVVREGEKIGVYLRLLGSGADVMCGL